MDSTIVIGLLSLLGTVIGTFGGIMASNKLTNYRIEQLEKKVDKYANGQDELRDRMIIVEQSTKSAHKRIDLMQEQLKLKDSREDR